MVGPLGAAVYICDEEPMTEAQFRSRMKFLWLGFVCCGILVTRGSVRASLPLGVQRGIYGLLCVAAASFGVVLYVRADRHAKAHPEAIVGPLVPRSGKFMLFNARVFFSILIFALVFGIWTFRQEPFLPSLAGLAANFAFMSTTFLTIRNSHLHRLCEDAL